MDEIEIGELKTSDAETASPNTVVIPGVYAARLRTGARSNRNYTIRVVTWCHKYSWREHGVLMV